MSEQNDERVARVIAEAKQLVGEIQSKFDAEDDFYRQQGLDPDEVRSAFAGCLDSVAAIGEELVRDDLVEIKHEVDAAAARLSLTNPAATRARKPRMMI